MSSELSRATAAGCRFTDFRKKIVIISRMIQGTAEYTMGFRIRSVSLADRFIKTYYYYCY